jgi:hypothetical protein
VWYYRAHPNVVLYNHAISEMIDPETAVLAIAEKMLIWKGSQLNGGDTFLLQKLADVRARLSNLKIERRTWRPRNTPQLMIVNGINSGTNFTYPGP